MSVTKRTSLTSWIRNESYLVKKLFKASIIILLLLVLLLPVFNVPALAAEEQRTEATPMISTGFSHSLALKKDGTVWAWGNNNNGELGDGTTNDTLKPQQVPDLTGIVAVSAGDNHSLALTADGLVWAWGWNEFGQLGDGTTTDRHEPVQVSDLSSVVAISGGGAHSLAVTSDGLVWAWGTNSEGQLGDGTTTDRHSPVQASGLTNIAEVSAGIWHSLALTVDGKAWAWGYNDYGQLGDSTVTDSYSPVQVTGLTNVISVSAGFYNSLALTSDGKAWTWGLNAYGELGDDTTTDRYTPVQVSDLTNVVAISAGEHRSLAVAEDGKAWAWGRNHYGQLGDGTTTDRHTPVQVSGLTNVVAGCAKRSHSLALKRDGTVWAWGSEPVEFLINLGDPSLDVEARIDNVSITPAFIESGDEITLQMTFTNTGDSTHAFIAGASLWEPGSDFSSSDQDFERSVSLEPGQSKTESWTYTVNQVGDWAYQFAVWEAKPFTIENLLHKYPSPVRFFKVSDKGDIPPEVEAVELTTEPANWQYTGEDVIFKAEVTEGNQDAEFAFYYQLPGGRWTLGRSYQQNNSWTASTSYGGEVKIGVIARTVGSEDFEEARDIIDYNIIAPVEAVELTADPVERQLAGEPVTFTAEVTEGNQDAEFRFYYRLSGGKWKSGTSYSTDNTWTASTSYVGEVQVGVIARAVGTDVFEEARALIDYSIEEDLVEIPITAIASIAGEAKVGSILKAGALTPAEATANYQWKIADKADGIYENIAGATSNNYNLFDSDAGHYIKVEATGTGDYTGTVTSTSIGPIVMLEPIGSVNINTASFEELQLIIHIGEERAQEIINLRPFDSLDGLLQVSGIGEGRLQDIKDEGIAYVE